MESNKTDHNANLFVEELRDCAKMLVDKLQSSDYETASELITTLTQKRDNHIYQSVGRLTRGLHNAIVNFNVEGDLTSDPASIEKSEIKDASDRLNYVISLTEQAADKTMDKVEASAPIAMGLGQESRSLREEWHRLKRREMTPDEFRQLYYRMDDFLDQMGTGADQLNQNLQEIILEQGYQDLTGQVLKKVIGLISDVESELVNLVRIAGQVEEITGLIDDADNFIDANATPEKKVVGEGEGPQVNADKRDDVVSNQDDVDDLLSSLGF
ncbi:protein phosphatase CheZ [Marinibactrum halimedae]|uniref:Protein phosphatase CheZ n=1 Tax=Marinibactrum halimedae TaxID=1444977 RepID=A0AA37T720_9GAMM|nr:protein phosphatase CheZ [Marinibactrum halimedae]MCD9459806.1 protein phosphatase CheZ [Marinibactrum halimedae]GLS27001.1 protein phosphatase CheZ [Marinibactrum halimedae]